MLVGSLMQAEAAPSPIVGYIGNRPWVGFQLGKPSLTTILSLELKTWCSNSETTNMCMELLGKKGSRVQQQEER